jgi:hypothetical protein
MHRKGMQAELTGSTKATASLRAAAGAAAAAELSVVSVALTEAAPPAEAASEVAVVYLRERNSEVRRNAGRGVQRRRCHLAAMAEYCCPGAVAKEALRGRGRRLRGFARRGHRAGSSGFCDRGLHARVAPGVAAGRRRTCRRSLLVDRGRISAECGSCKSHRKISAAGARILDTGRSGHPERERHAVSAVAWVSSRWLSNSSTNKVVVEFRIHNCWSHAVNADGQALSRHTHLLSDGWDCMQTQVEDPPTQGKPFGWPRRSVCSR